MISWWWQKNEKIWASQNWEIMISTAHPSLKYIKACLLGPHVKKMKFSLPSRILSLSPVLSISTTAHTMSSRLLSQRLAIVCRARPAMTRSFFAGAAQFNKKADLDLSDTKDRSPEDIIAIGFRRMREVPNYKKSEEELRPLLAAAQQLGISEKELRDIYNNTEIGTSSDATASANPAADTGFVPGSRQEELFLLNTLNVTQNIQNAHKPFEYDDIPALGHLQLRDHRLQREYNRIAAYELPQLAEFATPFRQRTDKQVVKLRYTTYMGEPHAAESKVVATFKTNALTDLAPEQRHKLRLLAGVRYDHENDTVKISANAFPEAAQNANYIGDVLRNLLTETTNPKGDSFADIPLRTSHVAARKRRNKPLYPQHEFPEAWKRPQDAPKPKNDVFTQLSEQYVKIPKL